jgi:hypothetical protein
MKREMAKVRVSNRERDFVVKKGNWGLSCVGRLARSSLGPKREREAQKEKPKAKDNRRGVLGIRRR